MIVRTNLQTYLLTLLTVLFLIGRPAAQERGTLSEYRDREYGYRFLYPSDWHLEELPEGEANPAIRARLQGPSASSFLVIIERNGQPLSKLEFQTDQNAEKKVEAMMHQTLEQTYEGISKSLGAVSMKIGETRNLSDEYGIKFYLATLHRMKTGNPVVVAGTHVYPFSKDYSVNFIMTAFHRSDAPENEVLTAVFNSFRMLDAASKSP
jgi:hypothetical protein